MPNIDALKYSKKLLKKYSTFRTNNNDAYIAIPGKKPGNFIVARVGDTIFDDFIETDFERKYKKIIPASLKKDCIRHLTAKIRRSSPICDTQNRVCIMDDAIYIYNGTEESVYKITTEGLKKYRKAKPKFIHGHAVEPFPVPDRENASLKPLWQLVNVVNNYDRQLLVTWMLFSFFTGTNKPILVFQGPKGCAKSYTQSTIKKIIDPSNDLLRTPPRSSDDIVIAAANSHVVSYNNISKLTQTMQDDMCLISTGGTYASRKKFTDLNEVTSDIRRAMMMNGITAFITADDLQQRCIFIHCDGISPSYRKREQELNKIFEDSKGVIFGWIVNSLIKVMKHIDSIETPDQLDRMADFYYFGHVVEKALDKKEGSFAKAFKANHMAHAKHILKSSPVGLAIAKLKHDGLLPFTGTMKELVCTLQKIDPLIVMEARKLSVDLKTLREPLLEAHSIEIGRTTRSGPGNKLTISCVE